MGDLTCQTGDFSCRHPGYVYWKGRCIEHLGPMDSVYGPMRKHWCDETHPRGGYWFEWVQDAINKCQHLERLQVPIGVGTFCGYYEWFMNAEKKEDIAYFPYLVRGGEFYLRGEDEIAFVEEEPVDNKGFLFFAAHKWNRLTLRWSMLTGKIHIYDGGSYHGMEKLGWDFGTRFWRKDNDHSKPPFNIIGQSWSQMMGVYGWYKLPEDPPFRPVE